MFNGSRSQHLQTQMLYLGGLIGPMASQTLIAMVPDMAVTFGKTVQEASFVVTLYMIPFASLMLFSSALVRYTAPHTVIKWAYALTFIGSLICFLAPTWTMFLSGVLVMSVSNAFTLPILQIILRNTVPAGQLGQALGRYFAMQSLGNCAGPLVAGAASIVNWKLMHVAVMALAGLMVVVGVPASQRIPKSSVKEKVAWGTMIIHILTVLAVGVSIIGMTTVLTIHLQSVFGMPASTRGLVIMVGGLAAFFFAPKIGASVDRYGALKILTACAVTGAIAVASMAHLPWAVGIAVLWGIAMTSAQGLQTTVSYSVLRTPGGAGFNAVVLSARFFGLALTPLLILPIYLSSVTLGFTVPALVLMVALALQWGANKRAK